MMDQERTGWFRKGKAILKYKSRSWAGEGQAPENREQLNSLSKFSNTA